MENERNKQIDRIVADNPDLPVSFVVDLLAALQEVADAQVTPYEFG